MKNIMRILAAVILLGTNLIAAALPATPPLEITEETPIVFAEKKNFFVLEDSSGQLKIADVLAAGSGFRSPTDLPTINSHSYYWVVQKVKNHLPHDYSIRIDPTGWESIDSYVVDDSGKITRLKPTGTYRVSHSQMVETNPFLPGSAKVASQFTVYTLVKNQEITLLTRVKSNSNLPARNFTLSLYDHVKFLEMRRYGLYIEGILLGVLLALAIFGWFSAFNNKDKASYAYSVWILIALLQIVSQTMPEGQRLAEFFIDVEGVSVGHQYAAWPLFNIFGYAQAIAYAIDKAALLRTVQEGKGRLTNQIFSTASGSEKSITTSAGQSQPSATATPAAGTPASTPALCSRSACCCAPSWAWRARTGPSSAARCRAISAACASNAS